MKSKKMKNAGLIIIFIFFAARMYFIEEGEPDNLSNNVNIDESLFTKGYVEHVIDGDTAWISIDGEDFKVRFIGINTPERDEDMYEEATEFTRKKIEDKEVYLEKDVSDVDQYGRMLRYVWLEMPENDSDEEKQNKMLNSMLVEQGLAKIVVYEPDTRHLEYLRSIN